jgi:hypothetical protein
MAVDVGAVAQHLFEGVMAPLVLGGPVRPGHAIGARVALALGDGERTTIDVDLEAHVRLGRVRRARLLAPIDTVQQATSAEWTLAAALHDILQAANPTFDAPLRRGAAVRILGLAREAIERVPPPVHARDALSRHTWFARALDIARTDTAVSWWVGSRTYLGVDPPSRLQAWPEVRRVSVVATPHPLVDLAPLAVDRERLTDALAALLTRTPLTELATCTRAAPTFTWSDAALTLVSTRAGRTLALRALEGLAWHEVDTALGRATRDLVSTRRTVARPAVALLADRALAEAQGRSGPGAQSRLASPSRPEATFARAVGAAAALEALTGTESSWRPDEWRRILDALGAATRSPEARKAAEMLGGDT